MTESLYGLVLAGGRSRRMQRDKALLDYHGRPQLHWTYDLVAPFCSATYVSTRPDQHDPVRDALPRIDDEGEAIGPAGGLLAAARRRPEAAWLVAACDLPFLDRAVLEALVAARDPGRDATAYASAHDGLPEPLCAIWEPAGLRALDELVASGSYCPRKALMRARPRVLDLAHATALDNINTPRERRAALAGMGGR